MNPQAKRDYVSKIYGAAFVKNKSDAQIHNVYIRLTNK